MKRRFGVRPLVLVMVMVFLGISFIGGAAAGPYPERRVEIIVPWGPGSNADVLARLIAPYLEKHFKQPFVVVNKTEGAGIAAHTFVAKAKPDGYTLLSLNSIYGGLLATRPNLPFEFDSFTPIIGFARTDNMWHFRKDSPWKSFPEFIADAKKNPGKYIYTATATFGSGHIITTDVFKRAGVEVKYVANRGSNAAMTALLGGHVDMAVIHGSMGHREAGTVRTLAISSKERRPDCPEIPTLMEMGYPIEQPSIVGLSAPKGTPKEVIQVLYEGARKALQENREAIKEAQAKLEQIPVIMGPEEFLERTIKDKEYYFQVVPGIRKELGLEK